MGPGQVRPWDSLRDELERQGLGACGSAAAWSTWRRSQEAEVAGDLEVVTDRLVLEEPLSENRSRLAESLESAFKIGHGRAAVVVLGEATSRSEPRP